MPLKTSPDLLGTVVNTCFCLIAQTRELLSLSPQADHASLTPPYGLPWAWISTAEDLSPQLLLLHLRPHFSLYVSCE